MCVSRNSKMDGFALIKQGAEARIYKGIHSGKPAIAKERFVKKYRHPELDSKITKERMKAESKIISRCAEVGIKTPSVYLVDMKTRIIFMEYFEYNITVKEFIETIATQSDLQILSGKIGADLGVMHSKNIVHGDLTSSNILLVNKNDLHEYNNVEDLNVVFVDFGLAHLDTNTEDKGVDLYVLERALISTHKEAAFIFTNILEGYRGAYKNCENVLKKFEEVRARGRKRTMIG